MAYLYISEFANSGNSKSGAQMQLGVQPAVGLQKVDYSGTVSVQSNVFQPLTFFIRVYATDDCHLAFGASPTATNNHMFLPGGSVEYFGIRPGDRLAVLRHTAH